MGYFCVRESALPFAEFQVWTARRQREEQDVPDDFEERTPAVDP